MNTLLNLLIYFCLNKKTHKDVKNLFLISIVLLVTKQSTQVSIISFASGSSDVRGVVVYDTSNSLKERFRTLGTFDSSHDCQSVVTETHNSNEWFVSCSVNNGLICKDFNSLISNSLKS